MDDIAQAFTLARILFWSLVISGAAAIPASIAIIVAEVYEWRRDRAARDSDKDGAAPG